MERFPDATDISLQDLYSMVSTKRPIKILGRGEIEREVTISAHAFSKNAVSKIEAAGGKAVALEG
jgi:large subunit ribosomal protein L15